MTLRSYHASSVLPLRLLRISTTTTTTTVAATAAPMTASRTRRVAHLLGRDHLRRGRLGQRQHAVRNPRRLGRFELGRNRHGSCRLERDRLAALHLPRLSRLAPEPAVEVPRAVGGRQPRAQARLVVHEVVDLPVDQRLDGRLERHQRVVDARLRGGRSRRPVRGDVASSSATPTAATAAATHHGRARGRGWGVGAAGATRPQCRQDGRAAAHDAAAIDGAVARALHRRKRRGAASRRRRPAVPACAARQRQRPRQTRRCAPSYGARSACSPCRVDVLPVPALRNPQRRGPVPVDTSLPVPALRRPATRDAPVPVKTSEPAPAATERG